MKKNRTHDSFLKASTYCIGTKNYQSNYRSFMEMLRIRPRVEQDIVTNKSKWGASEKMEIDGAYRDRELC